MINNVKYKDGEQFEIEDEPDTICICRPGYDGNDDVNYYHVINLYYFLLM